MTTTKLERLRELWGPHKRFPIAFVQYPEVNELLDLIPDLLVVVDAAKEVGKLEFIGLHAEKFERVRQALSRLEEEV